jgi:DNA-binding LacI/PurR family transcriptional regulator
MVSHLIGLGHRRIAFLAGPAGNEDSFWREKGYREAMADHDLAVAEALVGVGGFDEVVAETAVSQWLQQGLDIDAIFAADDESARGVMQAIQKANLRIPQDIALAGFDDSLLSRYLTPPLTTVHAPIEEAGRVATEKLIGLINDESVELLTLLPTELVIRRSCGADF